MLEQWKDIKDFEGVYWVSNMGQVKGKRNILAQYDDGKGYMYVVLHRADKSTLCVSVHKLVASHFLGVIPEGYEVNHLNYIKNDNRSENLQICTQLENLAHARLNPNRKQIKNFSKDRSWEVEGMNKQFFSIGYEYDNKGDSRLQLTIDVELIHAGILSKLCGNELKVLFAIASHMDGNGESFPSQERIAELTGLSPNTTRRAITDLLKVKIDGKPLFTRQLEGSGRRKKSKYSFVIGDNTVNNQDSEDQPKGLTAKEVLVMFMQEYEAEFGCQYKPSWIRETSMIKKQLLDNFTDTEVIAIVKLTITEYKKRWSSPKFPAPTVGAMCSWICNETLKIHTERSKSAATSKFDKFEEPEDLIL